MNASLTRSFLKTVGFLLSWLAISCLPACSLPFANAKATPSPSFTPIPSFTATHRLSGTATPSRTPSPTITLTATPFGPFNATILADNVNLRTNPGYLFDIRAGLPQGTQVLVLGRSLGGEWVYVRKSSDMEGWVFAQLLDSPINLNDAPVLEPGSIQLVTGRVLDEAGQPVSGIQFALIKGPGDNPPRTDAITGPDGMFYAYLPFAADGDWNIYYTAIACTSNVMDQNCNCLGGICGQPYPSDLIFTLPSKEPLDFVWK